MSENLAHPRHAPPIAAGPGWSGHGSRAQAVTAFSAQGLATQGAATHGPAAHGPATPGLATPGLATLGVGLAHLAGPETAVLALLPATASRAPATAHLGGLRLAALRLLAEEHVALHGGVLLPLGTPPQALLIRTPRDHAEALDSRLRLLLGEDAVASFDLPERAEALSERLAAERGEPEPGFAVALTAPREPLLRVAPALTRETLQTTLAALDALPPGPPPLLALPLACLRDEAFLGFAARHRRRVGANGAGLVAAVPLADLLAAPEAARRAAAALAHAGHRLGAALHPQALRLFDPSTIPASLLVTPWDSAWQRHDTALARAGAGRVLAMGVDSAAAVSTCRAAGIGAVAGRAAARLLAAPPTGAGPLAA